MKRTATQGFTLVELLISLALLGILLTAVVSVNVGISQSAAGVQVRNDLAPELQIAQNYMTGKLAQAAYVFPPGANIQMTANGGTTLSPNGSQNWKVGTDPIVAFVLPPKTVTANGCQNNANTNPNTYCYAFYAFYAIQRSGYLAAVSGADDMGANPANDPTAWVLMEYRGYYNNANNSVNTGFSVSTTAVPTGNQGRLLMDFLVPYGPNPPTPLFTTNLLANQTSAASQQAGVTTVTLNLAALQIVANRTIRVPDPSTSAFTTVTVYPRNVGKPMLNN